MKKDTYTSDMGITSINQQTELGETLKELNSDTLEMQTRLSGIDMRSRLNYLQVPSMVAFDTIVSLGVLPVRTNIVNRSMMRKSVSLEGKGRQEFVDIVGGKREQEAKSGIFGRMQDGVRSMFGMNRQQ